MLVTARDAQVRTCKLALRRMPKVVIPFLVAFSLVVGPLAITATAASVAVPPSPAARQPRVEHAAVSVASLRDEPAVAPGASPAEARARLEALLPSQRDAAGRPRVTAESDTLALKPRMVPQRTRQDAFASAPTRLLAASMGNPRLRFRIQRQLRAAYQRLLVQHRVEAAQALQAVQAERNRQIELALEALARSLSASQCTIVPGANGQPASISCPGITPDTTTGGSAGGGTSNGGSSNPGGSTGPGGASGTPSAPPPGGSASGGVTTPMVAASAPENPVTEGGLSRGQLDSAVARARSEWAAAGAAISEVSVSVADLPGLTLGSARGNSIVVDTDAAGWGWQAMDLTTVVRHEMGHTLGLDHTGSGLMAESLAPGEGRSVASAPPLPSGEPEPGTQPAAASPQDPPGGGGKGPTPAESKGHAEGAGSEHPAQPVGEGEGARRDPDTSRGEPTGSQSAHDRPVPPDSQAGDPTGPDDARPDAGTPEARPTLTVDGGVVTLTTEGVALRGTLQVDVTTGSLSFASDDGQRQSVALAGISRVVIVGTGGADTISVDLAGIAQPIDVEVDGRGGADALVVTSTSTNGEYSAEGDALRGSRSGATVTSRRVEIVVDLTEGGTAVSGNHRDLQLTSDPAGTQRLLVAGIVADAVLSLGLPVVGSSIDAGQGSISFSGSLDWAAGHAGLRLKGRHIDLTKGSSINTGSGDIELLATDSRTPRRVCVGDRERCEAAGRTHPPHRRRATGTPSERQRRHPAGLLHFGGAGERLRALLEW